MHMTLRLEPVDDAELSQQCFSFVTHFCIGGDHMLITHAPTMPRPGDTEPIEMVITLIPVESVSSYECIVHKQETPTT